MRENLSIYLIIGLHLLLYCVEYQLFFLVPTPKTSKEAATKEDFILGEVKTLLVVCAYYTLTLQNNILLVGIKFYALTSLFQVMHRKSKFTPIPWVPQFVIETSNFIYRNLDTH
jgi:hypothetical protein